MQRCREGKRRAGTRGSTGRNPHSREGQLYTKHERDREHDLKQMLGRAGSEFSLTGEHWPWDVRQLRATAGPCPRPAVPAPGPAETPATAPWTDPPPLDSIPLRPGLTLVVTAAGSAPVCSPSGCARSLDPRYGRRVSIRPQPKRAPRGEVSARGPTPAGGGRGMAWDQAAAALRLSLALTIMHCTLFFFAATLCVGSHLPPNPDFFVSLYFVAASKDLKT